MACQRIATEILLAFVSYLALKLYGMPENRNREKLASVSYLALKLYGMPNNYSTKIASLDLIPRIEAVCNVRESQQINC